jgi:hypothetical protein
MPRHKTPSKPKDGTAKSAKSSKCQEQQLRDLERQYSDSDKPTDVEEVWFSGAHCGESTLAAVVIFIV